MTALHDMPMFQRSQTLREQAGNRTERSFGTPPAVRLLPAVIIAAVVMLGFRIQVIVKSVADTRSASIQVEQSVALAQQAPAASGQAPAAPAATPAAPAAANGAAPAAAADGAAPAPAEGAPAQEGPPLPLNFDPANLTKTEIDTLQRLAERRETIERRERELESKEGLMKAAEARIDGKIGQLQDLERNIQSLLTRYDQQKQEEIDQLVRIYSAMKPKDAARIFDSLEMPILVGVIQKMRDAKVAPIMAMMDSRKATALTEELTARKELSAQPAPPQTAAAPAAAAPRAPQGAAPAPPR